MTWRRDVYNALANVNLGFEQVTGALESLEKAGILEDSTTASIDADLDNLWTGTNYVILSELHIRESGNQEAYDRMRTQVDRVREKLKEREKPKP